MDGTLDGFTDDNRSVAFVERRRLPVEERDGLGIASHAGIEHSLTVVSTMIAHGEEHPGTCRNSGFRNERLLTDAHYEVACLIGAHGQFGGTHTVGEQCTSLFVAVQVDPCIDGKVLVGQCDAGLCLCGGLCSLHGECGLVGHFCTVENTGDLEVSGLCELALQDVLVEGDAEFVACRQDAVGRLRLTQRTRTLHVLDKGYLLAGAIDFARAVGGY